MNNVTQLINIHLIILINHKMLTCNCGTTDVLLCFSHWVEIPGQAPSNGMIVSDSKLLCIDV